MYQDSDYRLVVLLVGSVAAGYAFGWVAGIAVFFIALSISPLNYTPGYARALERLNSIDGKLERLSAIHNELDDIKGQLILRKDVTFDNEGP